MNEAHPMGTLRFFEEVVSFKIRRTFGFADYKTVETAVNSLFFYYFRTIALPTRAGCRGEKRLSNTNA